MRARTDDLLRKAEDLLTRSCSRYLTTEVWHRKSFRGRVGWLVLTPFALGFSAFVRGRNLFYDRGWLPIESPVPKVISVGNLTVGGTGKTPFVLWLAQALQSRGYRIGILTRGYTGKNTGTTLVGTTGQARVTPDDVGDEAVMLARRFAGIVLAGRDRVAAAQTAYTDRGLDVVILDDGFQHRRLRRDIDLLLVSGIQGMGNGWMLPAGPLREPLAAARRADAVVITKADTQHECPWLTSSNTKPIFYGDLKPTALVRSVQRQWQELPLTLLGNKRVLALTSIADPLPFYRSVSEWEAEIAEVVVFPDHHLYTRADWQAISLTSQRFDLIVTTEKDLVKLEQFPFADGKLVALRVQMVIENQDQLLELIIRHLQEPPSPFPDAAYAKQHPTSFRK